MLANWTPAVPLSGENLRQVVNKQYKLVPFKKAVMPYSWEGNRRYVVALAMPQTSVDYPPVLQWPKAGRWTSRLQLHSSKEYGTLYLTLRS